MDHDPIEISPAQRNLAKLPPRCAARLPNDNSPILIIAGERGYHPLPPNIDVESYNGRLGVSEAQAEAMLIGSMYGWEVPGADPDIQP